MNLATASLYTMLSLLVPGFPQESGDLHHADTPALPAAANGWQLDAAIKLVAPAGAFDQDGPARQDSPARRPAISVRDSSEFNRLAAEGAEGDKVAETKRRANYRLPVRTARRRRYVDESAEAESTASPNRTLPLETESPREDVESGEVESRYSESRKTAEIQPRQLNQRERALRAQVRKALVQYFPRQLNTREHNCWEVMHSVIGYGTETMLRRGGPRGEAVNGIGYLCFNGPCMRDQLLYIERGQVAGRKGPRVQGHHGQFLAILAQSHVPAGYPLNVDGKSFTVADLVEFEQRGCRRRSELTFKLIALSHYLGTDAEWQSDDGAHWNIERLIQEELAQPIRGVACGGTHRMMGFSYALRKREKEGGEITGQFARARQFVDEYHKYTFALQNRDGSFSTAWFERRENRPDLTRRLQTSGHILEWMVFSVPEESLTDPRLVRAVEYVSGILVNYPRQQWEIGHLGHALHGLAIYDRRVFGSTITAPPYGIAANRGNVGRRNNTSGRRQERSLIENKRPSGSQHDLSRAPARESSVRQGAGTMPPGVAAAQRRLRLLRSASRPASVVPHSVVPHSDVPSLSPRRDVSADDAFLGEDDFSFNGGSSFNDGAPSNGRIRSGNPNDSEYAPTGPSLFAAP